MGFYLVKSSDWKGVLVSFFIAIISYKYIFSSAACLISKDAWNTLYLSISPFSLKTGSANLDIQRYHPNFVSLLWCSLRLASNSLSVANRNPYIFVIGFVFFDLSVYNKNVIKKHKTSNKSVKECVYGTIDFEMHVICKS